MDIRAAAIHSREHIDALDLRYRVLRAPLNMARGSERYAAEDACLHWVAIESSGSAPRVLGCVVFHPNGEGLGEDTGRLLQMAVSPEVQGQGVGRRLVQALERHVAAQGVRWVTLHARETAFGFYEALGYTYEGAPYMEVGIEHRNMRKRLGD